LHKISKKHAHRAAKSVSTILESTPKTRLRLGPAGGGKPQTLPSKKKERAQDPTCAKTTRQNKQMHNNSQGSVGIPQSHQVEKRTQTSKNKKGGSLNVQGEPEF